MSKLEVKARSELVQQLTSAGIAAPEQKQISKAIFPFVDSLIRQGADSQALKPILYSYAQYVKNIHDANQQTDGDFKFDSDYKKAARDDFERQLASNHIKNINDLGLDAIEEGLAKLGRVSHVQSGSIDEPVTSEIKLKPPAPAINHQHVESTNGINSHGEALETAEALAGKSPQHAKTALDQTATEIADSLEPIMQAVANTPDHEKSPLLDQILKTFGLFKEDKAGDVNLAKLDDIKKGLGEVMRDFSPEKFENFLKNLEPAERKALGEYMKNVLAPILAGGHGPMVAQNISEKFYSPMSRSLKAFEQTLKDRPVEPSPSEISLVSEKRNFISQALVLFAKDAEAKLKQNPNYDVQAHFNRMVPKLNEAIQTQFSADVVIYKDDIQAISSHLDNVKHTPKTKQKSDVQAFLNQYGKYALMAVPLILGPIATLISKVPIVGRPLASLAPFLNNTVDKFGPMLIGMFFASRNGDSSSGSDSSVTPAKKETASANQTASSVVLGA
jgi:hypothetical protein